MYIDGANKVYRTVTAIIVVASALVSALAFAAVGGLTPQEKRGKRIYLLGTNPEGKEIIALLGDPPMEVPGSLMACANCHGYDGRGKPEGGVSPSDITWEAMTKPYGVTHESGRKHPAYDAGLAARAIERGLDPAGNRLHVAMPRYILSPKDMVDLIAYLRRVGNVLDPGLTEETITVGTLIPGQGLLSDAGEAMESVLSAYFEDVNQMGGVFNRKIELRTTRTGASAGETVKELDRFLDDGQIFALVGAFMAGADKELAELLEEKEVPMIGPSTLYPQVDYPLNRHVFYLFSGIKEQGRALVTFASENLKIVKPTTAILYPDGEFAAAAAEAIEEQCRKEGWENVKKVHYPPGRFDAQALASELGGNETEVVFFLGTGANEVELARAAGTLDWSPYVLLPGSLAGSEILNTPPSFRGQVFVSSPMLPSEQARDGVMEYQRFAEKHKLSHAHLATKISAYSAAKVLMEGLKLAGRGVTREKLINALEGMYRYETGLTPPLTYGPNRRVGALGAYVMKVDMANKNLAPAGGWVQVR